MFRLICSVFFCFFMVTAYAGSHPVNINTANVKTLMQLHGIGAKKAADIVAYRSKHGQFASVDGLTKVHGIGPAFMKKLKSNNQGLLQIKSAH